MLIGCSDTTNKGEAQYNKAQLLLYQGKYTESVLSFEKVLNENRKSAYSDDALFKIGEIYFLNLNDFDKAVYYFNTLLSTDHKSEFAYKANRYLADIYENHFIDYDKAIVEYQKAKKNIHIPLEEKSKIQLRIAYSYFKMEKYYQAIIEFDSLIDTYPNSSLVAQAYYQKSNIYYIQGNCMEAKIGYNKLIEKFPKNIYAEEARVGIGECLDEEGLQEEALQVFTGLLQSYKNKEVIQMKIESLKKRIDKDS